MSVPGYKTSPGSYLVIQITGYLNTWIAEVVQENPLQLKVQESGPYANLKNGDYIILADESVKIQDDSTSAYVLEEYVKKGRPLISGLSSLNIPHDGKLYEILPP